MKKKYTYEQGREIVKKIQAKLEQDKEQSGDLLSNCCAWDFDPFGVEKEEGIYQERCLKCGKLCEPLYIGAKDIANIRRLEKLEKPKTEEPTLPRPKQKMIDPIEFERLANKIKESEPKDTCTCACHKSENMAVHTGQHCCSRAYEIFGPQPKEEWEFKCECFCHGGYQRCKHCFGHTRAELLKSEREKMIEKVRRKFIKIAIDGKDTPDEFKGLTLYSKTLLLLDELKEAGDE